jgi:hypothetical protein
MVYNEFRMIWESYIFESIKVGKALVMDGSISQEVLDSITSIDPTPTKKYVGWMCKQWALKNVDSIDNLRNTIEEFDSFLNRGKVKQKDINAYRTFSDLHKIVDHLNNSVEGVSVKDLESDYEVIRDDENLLIMVPHTHEASRKLGLSHFAFRDCGGGGKDSAWCTTYKAPNHFNDYYYKNNVTFYYIKVRSEEIQQKLINSGYEEQFFVIAIAVYDKSVNDGEGKSHSMEAYDGKDKQFIGEKLSKYLSIIGVN